LSQTCIGTFIGVGDRALAVAGRLSFRQLQ